MAASSTRLAEQEAVVARRARARRHLGNALLEAAAVEEDAVPVGAAEPDLHEVEGGELEQLAVGVQDVQAARRVPDAAATRDPRGAPPARRRG